MKTKATEHFVLAKVENSAEQSRCAHEIAECIFYEQTFSSHGYHDWYKSK